MNGRRRTALVAVAAAVVLLLLGWWIWRGAGAPDGTSTADPTLLERGPEVTVTLYFPSLSDRRLHAEERTLAQGSTQERARDIVEALLGGPRSQMLIPPMPDGVELAGVFVGDGGVVYLDLRQPDRDQPPAFGSAQETLAVYSLVDSVALNTPGVDAVVLLWNGQQQPTFGGHLDTARPLRPNRKLLAEGS